MSSAPFEEGLSYEVDSGYVSAGSPAAEAELPEVHFSKAHLAFLNKQLQKLSPQEILQWCLTSIPNLYQETALGLSGLVILDMLSKLEGPIKPEVGSIFVDTLHHFDETYELLERVRARYPDTTFHVYRPEGVADADAFAARYGANLWESDGESYDYHVKVEPSERAYRQLQVRAAITGRRRTQGGKRGGMGVLEVEDTGLVKVNPLANWSFEQVNEYVRANGVPYNALLDRGYKSVGDWHSTQPVAEGEDERAGRWKGTAKTECGLHNPKSRYAAFLREQQQAEAQKALDNAFSRSLNWSS